MKSFLQIKTPGKRNIQQINKFKKKTVSKAKT